MDLNKRFDQMDSEIKLLKNEIKQVLMDTQSTSSQYRTRSPR